MAAAHVSTRSILSSFLPRLSAPTASSSSRYTTLLSRQLSHPLLPSFGFAIPAAIQLNVPGMIEGIWESILKAVPKKRTSHMKQRSRRMAGKGLKDVEALNKCSVCGNVKRAHLLCPFCVQEVRDFFKGKETVQKTFDTLTKEAENFRKGIKAEAKANAIEETPEEPAAVADEAAATDAQKLPDVDQEGKTVR